MDSAHPFTFDQGSVAFTKDPQLDQSLEALALQRLKASASQVVAIDSGQGDKEIKGGLLVAVALCLADKLRKDCPGKRIGIVLPPGLGGLITNLAVAFAGKSAVNLNFTLGRSALMSCFDQAEVSVVISAPLMQAKVNQKFPDFPWPEHTLDIQALLKGLPKAMIGAKLAMARLLPLNLLASMHKIQLEGGAREAALLFTSGSDAAPKGVVLSHRNLVANVAQIREHGVIPAGARLLSNLPIFHSFGYTVQIWTVLLNDAMAIFTPSPLDIKGTLEAIKRHRPTIMLGTPTFLRPYLLKAKPEEMQSLAAAVVGAEKTPEGFQERWEKAFPQCAYLEGYGMTEASPVVSVNVAATRSAGTVGFLLSGMEARVIDPDTQVVLPAGQTGLLYLRGPNIFSGYLNLPEKTAEVLSEDGWYATGDLAKIDEQGRLKIEGRLSRFSKIGGEMASHVAVEAAVAESLNLADEEVPQVAIGAREDAAKGEVLVLLSTASVDLAELKTKLQNAGIANLWFPKEVIRVEAIPLLPTGKLDLKGIRKACQKPA
jgi:acyl-[acyl-carrier-protein]-phospholipid O-acyltransferase/long-chain-fatty-acid--[acyl-carrier-protein] ligase